MAMGLVWNSSADGILSKELGFSPVGITAVEETHRGPPVGWPGCISKELGVKLRAKLWERTSMGRVSKEAPQREQHVPMS